MDFTHTEERRLLSDTARRFLADKYTIATRHEVAQTEPGFSHELWASFAELGLIAALFAEQDGGFGGGGHDISVIFEELGRALVVEPFLPILLAGTAIAAAGSTDQRIILEQVIAGDCILAFAHGEPEGRYEYSHVATSVRPSDDGWVISGRKALVLNGDSADKMVVSARTAGATDEQDGISLFLMDTDQDGIEIRGYPTIDGFHAAEVELDNVLLPGSALLGEEGGAYPVIERAIGRGVLALSTEALGAMETAKDITLDYMRTRTQFGQPIGKFQALQHRMVDLVMEIEQVRSSVINAASRIEAPHKEREWSLSAAKQLAGTVGRLVAEETIQLHGGIGMTWEYPLAHYAKRLVMIDHNLGDADHHLERAVSLSRKTA